MKSPIPQEMRARTLSNLTVVVAGILLTAVLLNFKDIYRAVSQVLKAGSPFFLGLGIAFILLPMVKRLEWLFGRFLFRRKAHPRLSRVFAVVLSFLVLLAVVAGFIGILIPQIYHSIRSILQSINTFIQTHRSTINDFLLKHNFLNIEDEQLVVAWENVLSSAASYIGVVYNNIYALVAGVSNGVYRALFHALVGLIAALYLLLDKETYCAQVKKACYAVFERPTCETLIFWTRRASDIFAGFIAGKILDSLIIGVICYVCMLIFGFEYPLLISVIVGLTNVVPVVGPYFGAIPGVLFLLIVNPLHALWFLVFIIVLQQLDGNVIGPLILGDHVGLSAFWILLAIIVGGALFGFVGMLLSVPTFALIYAIVHALIERGLEKRSLPTDTETYRHMPEAAPVAPSGSTEEEHS